MEGVFVITKYETRRETKQERQAREQREAIAAQKSEVQRLTDWRARLMLKETEHSDGLRDAQKAIETHTRGLETTRKKLADAKLDLIDAKRRLSKLEKSAE
jgi:hypothetical protein